jgi:mRNA-degrading endonuclease RelE of RelBE toxin-antitoxin system
LPGARIEYKVSVAGDLGEVDASMARRILNKIERALRAEGKSGKPLTGEFAGLYRLRVKNYRIIYARTTEGYLVLRIGHRREVYSGGRP